MFACVVDAGRLDDSRPAGEPERLTVLLGVAQAFSPRVQCVGPDAVICDLHGLNRLFGTARTIAEELRREAADQGMAVRVGVAATRTAARLLAYGRPGITLIEAGEEAGALA